MSPTTSFGVVEKVRGGDSEAFEALFVRYRRRLAVLLRYKAGPELLSRTEIDDLLQETFIRAFRDIGSFHYERPGSFWNWLASIAGHVVLDAARFQGRQKRQGREAALAEPVDNRTPSLLFREKEAVGQLFERLDALPEDYRQVILLGMVEGLSTSEIADRMGKSKAAAALLLHRALKRFRTLAGDL